MSDTSKEWFFTQEVLDRRFTHHPPQDISQQVLYEDVRSHTRELASFLVSNCPDSRERSLALTKLEEAMFWANASIARNE